MNGDRRRMSSGSEGLDDDEQFRADLTSDQGCKVKLVGAGSLKGRYILEIPGIKTPDRFMLIQTLNGDMNIAALPASIVSLREAASNAAALTLSPRPRPPK